LRDVDRLVADRAAMNRELSGVEDGELARDRLRYRRWLADRIRRRQVISFLVETSRGEPVAAAILWLREVPPRPGRTHSRIPRLHAVYTRPEFRRQGAAGLILTAAIGWVRKQGYPQIALRTTPMARHLYEKTGFRPIPEMVLELGRAPPRAARRVRPSSRASERRRRRARRPTDRTGSNRIDIGRSPTVSSRAQSKNGSDATAHRRGERSDARLDAPAVGHEVSLGEIPSGGEGR
jgi:GNAT superfamily N-acetyltransferase